MVSETDRTKRALVSLLKTLAGIYAVTLNVTRESSDKDVSSAYRKLSRKTHPDRGGQVQHQTDLNNAHDAWEDAKKSKAQHGGSGRRSGGASAGVDAVGTVRAQRDAERKCFRFDGLGVLLTYQKFADTGAWEPFLNMVRSSLSKWKVRYWGATMETNADGGYHFHLMLQFFRAQNRHVRQFVFQEVCPNGESNDLLGEGWCKKKLQESLNRGFFYVFANKEGTVRNASGELLVAGNYEPAWTDARCKYTVKGQWLDSLFKAHKLSFETYDDYVHLARDGVPYRKRNLDACLERAKEKKQRQEMQERIQRIQSNPEVYQPFKAVPEAQAWLELFKKDALRYPLLVVHAPSYCGKTEWALSLFKRPLELRVGASPHFPEKMRDFDKAKYDGIVIDDVRDLTFVSENQEKLQGKYNSLVEFASTAGGTCAYLRDLFQVPVVVTVNNDTRNLHFLGEGNHDFLSKKANVHYLHFTGKPGEAPPATAWVPVSTDLRESA